jgi:hypothetical protein
MEPAPAHARRGSPAPPLSARSDARVGTLLPGRAEARLRRSRCLGYYAHARMRQGRSARRPTTSSRPVHRFSGSLCHHRRLAHGATLSLLDAFGKPTRACCATPAQCCPRFRSARWSRLSHAVGHGNAQAMAGGADGEFGRARPRVGNDRRCGRELPCAGNHRRRDPAHPCVTSDRQRARAYGQDSRPDRFMGSVGASHDSRCDGLLGQGLGPRRAVDRLRTPSAGSQAG